MDEWYFYQDEGKTLGPFAAEDIRVRLRDGRLRVFDLLYRDGDTKWRLALEHAAFAKEFRTGGVTALKSRPWVCLQRKVPNSQEFLTSGPYSTDEIRSRLQSGVITYGDYAWKDDFADWKRIGSLEEFNRRARGQNLPPVPSNAGPGADELIKGVVEFKRPNLIETPSTPPEAVTKNLAEELSIAPPPQNAQLADSAVEPELPPTPAAHVMRAQPRKENPQHELQRQRRLVDLAIPAALLLVLLVVIFAVSRVMTTHPQKVPLVDPQTEVEAPPKPEPVLEPVKKEEPVAVKEKPAPAPPKPSHPPTELTLTLPGANARVGKLDIRSDASSDFEFQIQIVGLPGQVSEGPAFYKFLKMPATGKLKEPLDLSGVKFPLGRFVLHVTIGEMKKDAKFSNGTAEAAFKGQLVRQRKLFSSPIFKERIQLLKISENLERQMNATKGRLNLKGLDALKGFKVTAGSNYLLFEDWSELREILKEAQTSVTPELMGRVGKERDHLMSFSVWR